MATQPIDGANRSLATLAGYAPARVPGPSAVSGAARIVQLIEVGELDQALQSPAPAAGQAAQPPTRAQVVAEAAQSAVVRQGGLAPLLADLSQALAADGAPPALRAAAQRLLSQARPLTPDVTGPELARSLGASGVLLEATLARTPDQSPLAGGGDLKANLLVLRQALAEAGPAGPRKTTSAVRPPPPYRGGPVNGQGAADPSLAPDDPLDVQRARLSVDTDAALARVELLQVASLPERGSDPVARWVFEAPLATPQGPAVAQFEISRDSSGSAGSDPAAQPEWRARFGVDFEPLGPVAAHLLLSGGRLSVNIWAERADQARSLQVQAQELTRRLQGPDLQAQVHVRQGTPPVGTGGAGRLLDQAV